MIPSWFDKLKVAFLFATIVFPVYATVMVLYGASPAATDIGYQPEQPVPFSHALHAGELGMDCRYCHVAVEQGAQATVPATSICMNCHQTLLNKSDKLKPIRDSFTSGNPVRWIRVHDLPDFAYFDHSAHVLRGVGCVSCHGRVDLMDEKGVHQVQPLSMGWCLECHRDPTPHLVSQDQITTMDRQAEVLIPLATHQLPDDEVHQKLRTQPSTDCSTCHR